MALQACAEGLQWRRVERCERVPMELRRPPV